MGKAVSESVAARLSGSHFLIVAVIWHDPSLMFASGRGGANRGRRAMQVR
jgi:hypothetical protein